MPVREILRLRGFDVSLAEDVLQEVLLRMAADDYRRLRDFRGNTKVQLRAYLRTTAVHLTQDLLRKWERTRHLEARMESEWPAAPDELTDRDVWAALDELASRMSEADLLKFHEILAAEGLVAPEEPEARRHKPPSERTLRRWKLELLEKYFQL